MELESEYRTKYQTRGPNLHPQRKVDGHDRRTRSVSPGVLKQQRRGWEDEDEYKVDPDVSFIYMVN